MSKQTAEITKSYAFYQDEGGTNFARLAEELNTAVPGLEFTRQKLWAWSEDAYIPRTDDLVILLFLTTGRPHKYADSMLWAIVRHWLENHGRKPSDN